MHPDDVLRLHNIGKAEQFEKWLADHAQLIAGLTDMPPEMWTEHDIKFAQAVIMTMGAVLGVERIRKMERDLGRAT